MGPYSRPANGPQNDPRPLARQWRHTFVTKRGFGNDYRKSYEFLYQKTIGTHNQKRHQKTARPYRGTSAFMRFAYLRRKFGPDVPKRRFGVINISESLEHPPSFVEIPIDVAKEADVPNLLTRIPNKSYIIRYRNFLRKMGYWLSPLTEKSCIDGCPLQRREHPQTEKTNPKIKKHGPKFVLRCANM